MTRTLTPPEVREHWLQQLAGTGHRLTSPRIAIVDALLTSEYVLTPQALFDLARHEHPQMGLVSVYRTLEILEQLGLVERVHHAYACQGYVAAANGHQHLLICEKCGRAEYFAGDQLEALTHEVERRTGYQVKQHWLQLLGACENCKQFAQ